MTEFTTNHPQARHQNEGTPPQTDCPDHTWCTNADSGEHVAFHAGDVVQLAGTPGDGWHAWPLQDRGRGGLIALESDRAGEPAVTVEATPEALAAFLAATATPEGHARLAALVATIDPELTT